MEGLRKPPQRGADANAQVCDAGLIIGLSEKTGDAALEVGNVSSDVRGGGEGAKSNARAPHFTPAIGLAGAGFFAPFARLFKPEGASRGGASPWKRGGEKGGRGYGNKGAVLKGFGEPLPSAEKRGFGVALSTSRRRISGKPAMTAGLSIDHRVGGSLS